MTNPLTVGSCRVLRQVAMTEVWSGDTSPPRMSAGSVDAAMTRSMSSTYGTFSQVYTDVLPRPDTTVMAGHGLGGEVVADLPADPVGDERLDHGDQLVRGQVAHRGGVLAGQRRGLPPARRGFRDRLRPVHPGVGQMPQFLLTHAVFLC